MNISSSVPVPEDEMMGCQPVWTASKTDIVEWINYVVIYIIRHVAFNP